MLYIALSVVSLHIVYTYSIINIGILYYSEYQMVWYDWAKLPNEFDPSNKWCPGSTSWMLYHQDFQPDTLRKQFGQQVDFQSLSLLFSDQGQFDKVTFMNLQWLKNKHVSSQKKLKFGAGCHEFWFFTSFPCQATHRKGRNVKDTKALVIVAGGEKTQDHLICFDMDCFCKYVYMRRVKHIWFLVQNLDVDTSVPPFTPQRTENCPNTMAQLAICTRNHPNMNENHPSIAIFVDTWSKICWVWFASPPGPEARDSFWSEAMTM